jgi:hypothetical protein
MKSVRCLSLWLVAGVSLLEVGMAELAVSPGLVSAGGGSSASARFELVGSVGQSVAGTGLVSTGALGLRSGFWSQVIRWINAQPEPGSDVLTRRPGDGAQILISRLLLNDFDADFDRVTFAGFASVSAGGGNVYREGPWLIYQPPVGLDPESDVITYRITDGLGGPVTGQIQVVRSVPPYDGPPNALGIEVDPGDRERVRVRFQGISGRSYVVQTASAITGPWGVLGPVVAGSNGAMEILDTLSLDPRFYRLVEP